VTAQIVIGGERRTIMGEGNGPIDAFVHAVQHGLGAQIDVVDYAEHAMGQGSEATAVAYVETTDGSGNVRWGVGMDPNIITASFRAVLGAYERHTSN
jgi:2-isopropylmalate synthase